MVRFTRVALILAVAFCGVRGFAQNSDSDLPQLYSQALAAFRSDDYAKAAADFEALISKAEFSPTLEPAFYTLGCAYFNLSDFRKAGTAFKNYQAKFPNGAHASEAAFALAQCNLSTKDYAPAAAGFASLERDPRFREQALLNEATALQESGKADGAIGALEKLSGGELKTPASAKGALTLAQLYAQKGAPDKAVAAITKLRGAIQLADNIIEFNSLTIELGDQLYAKKFYDDALACYRVAFPREQLEQMQNERITKMQQTIEENLLAARSNPSQFSQLANANAQINAEVAKSTKLLEELHKVPNFTPAIYIRMARAYSETDRKWEAVVVYQELLERYSKGAEREPALFGLIVALADVNQFEKSEARCEEYLRDFKTGPNADTVGYLLGAVALQANDPRAAETYFGRMLQTRPKSNLREQMRYLLANAKFMSGKFDDAKADYEKYLVDYPKGQNFEDVTYRIALTALFSGKYEDAMKQLNAYLQKYPRGAFVSDARYRLDVCKYAASLYDEVIHDCKAWENDFPKNQQLGEVLALLADSYAATNREDEAVETYERSYKIAATDEVMNYSLFAASKLLQKHGDWNRVASLFEDFLKEKPDHPTAITALYWIGKAKAHDGKIDEAKQLTADTIKKYIADPQREAVEMLLTQLAQLCVKKKGEPQISDPGAELDRLLGSSENSDSPTAKARILFAKAELARLRRQPAEQEKNIARVAEDFKPEDLSPMLLGMAGDYLLAQKKPDAAEKFYQRLMDEFPKGENVDFAYNGLAEIALERNDLLRALHYFSDATDKIAAQQKLKDVTVGKAKTLLAMGKLDEAKKVFEQVAAVREWRGESTAFSVYSLGEIERRQGHYAEANAYFQRVYIGYQKFLPWVAKAYIASGESFEKLNKPQEAAKTYQEMLRNEKLATFSETQEAKKRLGALGQG